MSELSLYTTAYGLAEQYHRGQKYGELDYFRAHVRPVAKETSRHKLVLSGEVDMHDAGMVGLLHDILEDTECTEDILREFEIPEQVITAVKLLTKVPGYKEDQYFEDIVRNPLALVAKASDMTVNLSNSVRDGNRKRIMKYTRQLPMLFPLSKTQPTHEKMFHVGETYEMVGGGSVEIVVENTEYRGYETVACADGVYRYNRPGSYGRVTGTGFNRPDPRNLKRIEGFKEQ